MGRLQIPLRREKNGQVAFWSPSAHALAGGDLTAEAQDQPRVATAAGPCARRGEAALQADSCSQAHDTAWQALAPGRDTHLSQGSQAQPQLLSVRHPGCPVHRGLRANKPFFRQCQRLTSQVFILSAFVPQTLRMLGWMSLHFHPDWPFQGVSHSWSSSGSGLLHSRNRKDLLPMMMSQRQGQMNRSS